MPGQLSEGNLGDADSPYRRGAGPFRSIMESMSATTDSRRYRSRIYLAPSGRVGERYILGGENASLLELYRLIDKVDGKKHWKLPMYKCIPLLVAHSLKLWAHLTGMYPLITPGWIRTFCVDWKYTCDKARNELGYDPIPLEEGLKRTCEWLDRIERQRRKNKQ